jgi:hypothetical protein
MYLPCLVFPYQRLPGQWYTPLFVLTHTFISFFSGCCWANAPGITGEIVQGTPTNKVAKASAEKSLANFIAVEPIPLFNASNLSSNTDSPEALVA